MIHLFLIGLFVILFSSFNGSDGHPAVDDDLQQPECTECHEQLVKREYMHYPVDDDCSNCHESTGASHPMGDSAGFRLMDQVPALCYYCHEERGESAFTHLPVEEGECLGCHDIHGSSKPSLLRSPDPGLCLSCHNRDIRDDSSNTINISRLVTGKMIAHTAISGGGCMTCHQAHGSGFREILVDQFPSENYLPAKTENFALCFLCHNTGLLDEEETGSETNFRDGRKNLHWLHMNGERGRNCRMCHNIHGSPQPFLVEETVGFGNWEMRLNFIPTQQGGSCLPGCHGKLMYLR